MKSLVSPYHLNAEFRWRVPFHDVDLARVVWHGHYFKYFELARCELLERIEYSYDAMMRSGCLWPIVDTQARFLRPAFFNQELIIEAALMEWELRLVINYEIRDLDGAIYTRASTTQVPLDAKTYELIIGTPQNLVEKMEHFLTSQARGQ
jgi:acyl-CoA thioester hydrolase